MYSSGTLIGEKYRLDTQIGEGGMASVWRAIHTTLKRPVAIKFVQLHGPDQAIQRERFLREAQLSASIRHRCVVDIVDFGQMEDGQPYMVMELLEGETLGDRLVNDPRLEVDEIVRIFDMVLGGLAAIHDKGIVHRDLKPDNIFLLEDAEGILPKLMDFGISRVTSRASQRPPGMKQQRPITRQGTVTGTPDYMSPEQARGLAEIDARSDIFTMGVLLYEALSNRPPFEGVGVGDVLVKIIADDPTPLVDHGVDAALAEVVEMAMAKDPEDRFHTAREMRMAIRAATRLSLSSLSDSQNITSSGVKAFVPVPVSTEGGFDGGADTVSGAPETGRRWPLFSGALALVGIAAAVALAFALRGPEPAPGDPLEAPVEVGVPPAVAQYAITEGADDARAPAAEEPIDSALADAPMVDAPVETITVELLGLPENATVRIDGEPFEGDALTLPRDETARAIEVTAPGRVPWAIEHITDADGRYEVDLRRVRRRGMGRMMSRRMSRGMLLRELDF